MHAINTLVPPGLVHEILKIHLPRWVNLTDTPSWQGSTDGGFSSAAAYDLLQAHSPNVTHWKWVWKLKIPQKFKGFLWLVLHGKLLTNCMHLKRSITVDSSCPSCGGIEDLNHVLRACPVAMEVWSTIFDRRWYVNGLSISLQDWITTNSTNKKRFTYGIPWATIFITTLWHTWKNRNKKIFENKAANVFDSVKLILETSLECFNAFARSITSPKSVCRLIKWLPPPAGVIKLNVDGCTGTGTGPGGFGGLFRDEQGTWISGYYGRLETCTSLEAELWAVYKGLTIILQRGLTNVIVETDAEQVVKMLTESSGDNFPFRGLVEDARIIMQGCACEIKYILREGNTCADALVKFGAEQPEDLLVVNEPPMEIRGLLVADILGVSRERA
ncbi:unnamed protein product [Camellia sinensis]